MVKINRANAIPNVLVSLGKAETDQNIADYKVDVSLCGAIRKFSFKASIYGHQEVKNSLKNSQYNKCCFCESKVDHISHGDIEHFRPKGGYIQQDGDELAVPGYFWLAYDWSNLLFCCQICNQRFKKNLFPLIDPTCRAGSPDLDINLEKPVFINPVDENPEEFIGFHGDTPFPIDDNSRGNETIESLGLKREPLRSRRAELLEKLKLIYAITVDFPESPYAIIARQLLSKSVDSSREYSVAVKCSLKNGFQYI